MSKKLMEFGKHLKKILSGNIDTPEKKPIDEMSDREVWREAKEYELGVDPESSRGIIERAVRGRTEIDDKYENSPQEQETPEEKRNRFARALISNSQYAKNKKK